MDFDVSIILISYNKYPQNLFTLYSLQRQTYDPGKMEVILVDDNSTDQTVSLKSYNAPFQFKYLRSTQNLDRAGAKNLGVKEAKGKVVIFLDAEIMVSPDFVANHLRHYRSEEQVAVSGTSSHFCTFTVLYPDFTREQILHLHSFMRKDPLLLKIWAKRLGLPFDHLWDLKQFLHFAASNKKHIPLFSKEDIYAGQYTKLSYPLPSFPQVYQKFDEELSGYHLAWTFFITRNVSVEKRFFEEVGLFNEKFKGWGYEDWEWGYRLYKKGVKFIEDKEIITYHQEHPFSVKNRRKEQMRNYATFVSLHPEIEVCALTLDLIKKRNLLQVNEIIKDYYLLSSEFTNKFAFSRQIFIKLTQQIPLLLWEGKGVRKLVQQIGLDKEPGKIKKLLDELRSIRNTGKYRHLLSAFDLLMGL